MKRGDLLAKVVCSKAYASPSRAGSLHAEPKKEIPTGSPATNPAGTVICGYPATAAGCEHIPDAYESPLTGSLSHAGPVVGATIAFRSCAVMTASIPSSLASR